MKVSVFAVLLVLYLSVCGAFATHKRTKCRKQKGAAITKGTKITTWNWMSSDPADEKMTWRECKSSCQVDGDCKGWSYQYVFATSVAPFTQSRHLVDPVHPDIQSVQTSSPTPGCQTPAPHCLGSLRLFAGLQGLEVDAASTPRSRSTRRTTSACALPMRENASRPAHFEGLIGHSDQSVTPSDQYYGFMTYTVQV